MVVDLSSKGAVAIDNVICPMGFCGNVGIDNSRSHIKARNIFAIMQFGERLASERKRLGYRGADFANACGVTPASQSLYENDKRTPDAAYLMKACEIGADPMFLLMGTPSHPAMLQVSEEEKQPLAEFYGLSPRTRAVMMALVKAAKEDGQF